MKITESLYLLKKHYQTAKPSLDFRKHGWNALVTELGEQDKPTRFAFRPGQFILATATFVLLISVGTVFASQRTLPNQTLFPVKVLSEKIAVRLAPASFKAEIAAGMIDRRLTELATVTSAGNQQSIEQSVKTFKATTDDLTKLNLWDGWEDESVEEHRDELQNVVKSLTPTPTSLIAPSIEREDETEEKESISRETIDELKTVLPATIPTPKPTQSSGDNREDKDKDSSIEIKVLEPTDSDEE